MKKNSYFTEEAIQYIEKLNKTEEIQSLKLGMYSKVFIVQNSDKNVKIRFYNNNNRIKIAIENKQKISFPLKPIQKKEGKIALFDKELNRVLWLDKDMVTKKMEEEVNLNLSKEQKELLINGKEVTLEVFTDKKISTSTKSITKRELEHKTFVADLSFFLQKNSIVLHEKKETQKLTLKEEG